MTSDNESELRDRMGGALGTVTPSGPPVDAVMHRGRGIRFRRRVTAVVTLAVIAAAAIAVPALTSQDHPAVPEHHMTRPYHVSVNPPGPHAPRGEIATGNDNGLHWHVLLHQSGHQMVVTGGGGLGPEAGNVAAATGGDPALLGDVGDATRSLHVGPVAAGVTRLTMTLANHQELTLHPVRWHDRRWVAVLLPTRLRIERVAAYSGDRELRYAVPFRNAVSAWLRPGRPGLPRRTVRIATFSRHAITTGYAGPWGVCLVYRVLGHWSASGCNDGHGTGLSRTVASSAMCSLSYIVGVARPAVARLRFTLSSGRSRQPRTVRLAGSAYFAFRTKEGVRVQRWTAYNAAGDPIGSGAAKSWSSC